MKHILKFSFSIFILLVSFTGTSQEVKKKDSIKPKTERYGLRVGIDLNKLSRSFYDKNYKGLELVGDFKFTRSHYLAVDLGNENKTTDDTRLNFTTKGTFLKAGFDYNMYENWTGMNNMLYVGLRFGVSSFSQTLNSYSIYNANPFFGEAPIVISGEKYNGLSAQWIEVVAGLKAELFNNFYAGFSIRMNNLVSNKTPENFDNLYIPGFNRTHGGNFGAGFNYTISYFLPLYKSSIKPKEVKGKKK